MRTWPRLVGRRLQTDAVIAGKGWRGSPNLSRESGWTWNSTLAVGTVGVDFAKPPSWLGAMVRGPVRNTRYSSPIIAFPQGLLARWFRVTAFRILKIMRS